MAQKITRTVQFTRITCVRTVVENKKPRLEPMPDIVTFSKVTDAKKAESIVSRMYGANCTVIDVVREAGLYEMDLSKFVSLAQKVKDVPIEDVEAADDDTNDGDAPTFYDDDDEQTANDLAAIDRPGGGEDAITDPGDITTPDDAPAIPGDDGNDATEFPGGDDLDAPDAIPGAAPFDDDDDVPALGDDDVPPEAYFPD